jgi:hypothetical protein
VRAETLDGEGTGHADLLLVVVGLVVEVFKLGLGGDGLVDLLLPGDAERPELVEQGFYLRRPILWQLARNLPLFQNLFLASGF